MMKWNERKILINHKKFRVKYLLLLDLLFENCKTNLVLLTVRYFPRIL